MIRTRPHLAAIPPYTPGTPVEQLVAARSLVDPVRLSANENPFSPPAPVLEAMSVAAADSNRYPRDDAPELREAIAASTGADLASVAVGCGSLDLFFQVCLALLDPGDVVVCPALSFPEYWRIPQVLRADVRSAPMAGFEVDLDAMLRAVDADTRLVVVGNPNNPTGTVVTPARLKRFLSEVPASTAVLVDEAYVEFCEPSLRPPSVAWLKEHPNLVVTRSFSKAMGIGGIRLGYLMADPAFLLELRKVHLTFAVSGIAQAAGVALLSEPSITVLAERVEQIRAERARLEEAVANLGLPVVHSEGNFLFIPTSQGVEIVEWLVSRGVLVRLVPRAGVRMTVGDRTENGRLLSALEAWSASHAAEHP